MRIGRRHWKKTVNVSVNIINIRRKYLILFTISKYVHESILPKSF